MSFWIRNIIFGIILIMGAYLLLVQQGGVQIVLEKIAEWTKPSMNDTSAPESEANSQEQQAEKPAPKPEKKSTNAAAEGLSRFYASINPSFDDKETKIRENIVYLPDPKGDLTKLLQAREKVTRPLRKSWRGDREARPFRVGETLYQKLAEYSHEQGIEIIWWLNRDFLIKDPFRIDQDIVKTAYQIGKAVGGHFEEGIDIHFCYKHRAIVLIDKKNNYLETECDLIGSKNSNW